MMRRAYSLSMHYQMVGDLVARREWQQIMEKCVHMAKSGGVQAIEF